MGLDDLTNLLTGSVAATAGAGALLWTVYTRCYVSVPPNRALVLYDRRSRRHSAEHTLAPDDVDVHRPRIVVGGRVFIAPWNKGVGRLSLDPVSVDISVRSMHALGSRATGWEVRLHLQAKIPAEPGSLLRAAENLLGKTDEEIRTLVGRTVEAAVPAVLSRVPLEDGEPDWNRLADEIHASVAPDLLAWGFVVRTLSVTELRRIVPPEASALRTPAKPLAPSGSAGEGSALDALQRGFDARLARAERNIGIVGAAMARFYEDTKAGGRRELPFSVLDYPLGYEARPSLVPADSPTGPLHESMEGEVSPLSPSRSMDRALGERGRDDSLSVD